MLLPASQLDPRSVILLRLSENLGGYDVANLEGVKLGAIE